MLKNLKIFTDFTGAELEKNPDLYAICTYHFERDIGRSLEKVKIVVRYTDREGALNKGSPIKPYYDFEMTQTLIQDVRDPNSTKAEFLYKRHAFDVFSILNIIGDTPVHREFLTQIGFHE